MKTHFIALAILLVALLGCRKNEQADGKSQAANVLTSITFQVDDPERKADGPSSYINLAEPEKDLKHLRNAEEVVFTGTNLIVVLDYPLHNESTFPINASAPSDFTRAEIVRKIADLYKKVYEE